MLMCIFSVTYLVCVFGVAEKFCFSVGDIAISVTSVTVLQFLCLQLLRKIPEFKHRLLIFMNIVMTMQSEKAVFCICSIEPGILLAPI